MDGGACVESKNRPSRRLCGPYAKKKKKSNISHIKWGPIRTSSHNTLPFHLLVMGAMRM